MLFAIKLYVSMCVGLSVIECAQFSVMLSDADACAGVTVCVLPLRVVQVFVWFIQVPALAFLSIFCVVHGSSVIFPITVHTLNYAAMTHTDTHSHKHTEQQFGETQKHTIKASVSSLCFHNETLTTYQ